MPRNRFQLKLTQSQQASKIEPELGTAQPQLVFTIYLHKHELFITAFPMEVSNLKEDNQSFAIVAENKANWNGRDIEGPL